MTTRKDNVRLYAILGICASILIFLILGVVFVMAGFTLFSYIDSYPPSDLRVKSFIDFFDHPGFNGFTLLGVVFIMNAGLFVLSLFFFIMHRDRNNRPH